MIEFTFIPISFMGYGGYNRHIIIITNRMYSQELHAIETLSKWLQFLGIGVAVNLKVGGK